MTDSTNNQKVNVVSRKRKRKADECKRNVNKEISKLPINPNKLNDIINITNKCLPSQYKNFYNILTASNASED